MADFNKIDIPVRISLKFDEIMRKSMRERFVNKIDSDDRLRSMREMTDMVTNCPSFKNALKELTTIKRKEDLFK